MQKQVYLWLAGACVLFSDGCQAGAAKIQALSPEERIARAIEAIQPSASVAFTKETAPPAMEGAGREKPSADTAASTGETTPATMEGAGRKKQLADPDDSSIIAASWVVPVVAGGQIGGGRGSPGYREVFSAGPGFRASASFPSPWRRVRVVATAGVESLSGGSVDVSGTGRLRFSDWTRFPICAGLGYEGRRLGSGPDVRPYVEGTAGTAILSDVKVEGPTTNGAVRYADAGAVPLMRAEVGLRLRHGGLQAHVGAGYEGVGGPEGTGAAKALFDAAPGWVITLPVVAGIDFAF